MRSRRFSDIAYLANKRTGKRRLRPLVIQATGEAPKHREISRSFQIENPSCLFCLRILIRPDLDQYFTQLRALIIQIVRLANECHYRAPLYAFAENDFRVACGDDLAA